MRPSKMVLSKLGKMIIGGDSGLGFVLSYLQALSACAAPKTHETQIFSTRDRLFDHLVGSSQRPNQSESNSFEGTRPSDAPQHCTHPEPQPGGRQGALCAAVIGFRYLGLTTRFVCQRLSQPPGFGMEERFWLYERSQGRHCRRAKRLF